MLTPLFFAWVMKTFCMLNNLSIPNEIVQIIIKLCRIRTKIIVHGLIIKKDNILFSTSPMPTIATKRIPVYIRQLLESYNILGIKFFLSLYSDTYYDVAITKCNRIMYASYNSCIKHTQPLNFGCVITKILRWGDGIVIIDEFARHFHLYHENHGALSQISCIQLRLASTTIVKILSTPKRTIHLDSMGNVFLNTARFIKNDMFKKVCVSQIIQIYTVWGDNFEYFIFLSVIGEIYSAGNGKNNLLGLNRKDNVALTQPRKINLHNVSAIYMNRNYCLALTMSNDLWMWGSVDWCGRDLGTTIKFGRKICPLPLFVGRINLDQMHQRVYAKHVIEDT